MVAAYSGVLIIVEVARGSNGASGEQATQEVCPQGLPRGNVSPSKVVILLSDCNSTCSWLENHTLVGYFLGCIPSKSIIRTWIQQTWHEVKVDSIQNLTKGFFLICFSDPSQA